MRPADQPVLSAPWLCVRCTGLRGAHYLTCLTLQLPADWWVMP